MPDNLGVVGEVFFDLLSVLRYLIVGFLLYLCSVRQPKNIHRKAFCISGEHEEVSMKGLVKF